MSKRLFLFFGFSIFLLFLVFFRVVDTDELAFLTAAFETLKGKVAYKDFFLPQMPLSFLPLLFFAKFGITGFFAGRILNLLFGLLFGWLFFVYLRKRLGGGQSLNPAPRNFFSLFYFANGLFLSWIPVNKPHILVNTFNLLSLLFLYRGGYFLSGLFLGLAGETRAIFLLFLPLYLFYIYRAKEKKKIGRFLSGFFLPQVIGLYYFLSAPKNFLINNLYYHLVRGDVGEADIWLRFFRDEILFGRFFMVVKVFVLPQNLLLLLLTLFAFSFYKRDYKRYQFEFFSLILGALTFFLYYLVVAPAHFQYFIQVLPFLFIFNIPFLEEANRFLRSSFRVKLVLSLIISFYLFGSLFTISNYASGFHPFYKRYQMSIVKEVAKEIEENSKPEDRVLVFFPNFQVLARRRNLSGYETCPDFPFAERFSAGARRVLNLSSRSDLRKRIEAREPALIVGTFGEEEKRFYQFFSFGYKKIGEVLDYEIYQRSE